ncbi:VOC family protein [Cryobacterium psychrophilum]|uniref:Putative pterin-4-alpha-carbinolamine dehydratase n=1 Tax=Cryobacterium psychrophilum TaxID=41988 RepID=A0A4Y8KQ14_9MICO|nr:VOC family protein [Cryobacterium psychrophilum]TDW29051.1 4a-hydroxytetrahydrobiopterin dehydratase [Cryobacterium psychrophilum]TFD79736.1 pterin-4-alpha-carbinolamine dehydratase [Cryobacterium psychrophilum]
MNPTPGLLAPFNTAHTLHSSAFVHFDSALHASFTTADFTSAVALLAAVSGAADALNHHPDVRLGYGNVDFVLTSHDVGGVTARDVRLATRIDELAAEHGATVATLQPTRCDIAIDCTDSDAIRPFWVAALGYREVSGDDGIELVDPRGRGPKVWFQHMEIARTDRNRIHLDVYVPNDDAEERVQTIIEAGGVLLTDEHAPEWWVLADVEGNEMCVCTASF